MTDIIHHITEFNKDRENATQLATALEHAVKQTLSDHAFRITLGATPEYWCQFNKAVGLLSSHSNEPCLINLIKLARNVVAGELHNQTLAITSASLDKIEQVMFKSKTSESDNSMILQVCTQAICNMITNNPAYLDSLWKMWMSNEERGSIWSFVLAKSNQDLIMSALVLMVNCLRNSKERCDLLIFNRTGQDIIAAMLGDMERLHGNEQCKNFELGYTVFSELITFGHFKQLYTHIDDYSEKALVSDHQTILLKLLDSKIHAYKGSFSDFIGHEELSFLVQLFEMVSKETMQVVLSVKNSNDQDKSDLNVEQVSNIYTSIILLLQIINRLLVDDEEQNQHLKQLLIQVNALAAVTDILGHLETIKLPPVQVDNPLAGFNFLKRECVRLMGTLCHKDRSMQNKIRELGGIPLILCQFKIDDSNPYLREYATLALRNIMENNLENQKIIEELEPEQVVQSKELTEMGITPELTEDGKVRIKRT